MSDDSVSTPESGSSDGESRPAPVPRTVRLPGFVSDEPVGLGDVIKRVTTLAGIKPCGGCARRAESLNRRVVFVPRGR